MKTIEEIMALVDYYNGSTKWGTTEQQLNAYAAIESALRELVHEPLSDQVMWDVVMKDIAPEEFNMHELNVMFDIGRNTERAHKIGV